MSVQQDTGILLTLLAQCWGLQVFAAVTDFPCGLWDPQSAPQACEQALYLLNHFFTPCSDNFQPTISLHSIWERNKVRLAGNLSWWETTDLAWICAEQMVYFSTLSYWAYTSFRSPFDFDYWKRKASTIDKTLVPWTWSLWGKGRRGIRMWIVVFHSLFFSCFLFVVSFLSLLSLAFWMV